MFKFLYASEVWIVDLQIEYGGVIFFLLILRVHLWVCVFTRVVDPDPD
jgi:hypothetical protein